jgi:glycosyltransferase involved in cell wall biosynthesis
LQLIIVGDGPERARLQAAARGAGVRLTLPGWVPRAQVSRWLHAADVYAQPSRSLASGRSEGLPVAALEALAVGLPVVATEQAGLRELTSRHPSVHLVAPDDRAALATALAADLSRFCVGSVTAV